MCYFVSFLENTGIKDNFVLNKDCALLFKVAYLA